MTPVQQALVSIYVLLVYFFLRYYTTTTTVLLLLLPLCVYTGITL